LQGLRADWEGDLLRYLSIGVPLEVSGVEIDTAGQVELLEMPEQDGSTNQDESGRQEILIVNPQQYPN
jgi:hypothetical protein